MIITVLVSFHSADYVTKADSLSCDIVDPMQLFTRDSLLKELSPPATDTGIVTKILKAMHIWGKMFSIPLVY